MHGILEPAGAINISSRSILPEILSQKKEKDSKLPSWNETNRLNPPSGRTHIHADRVCSAVLNKGNIMRGAITGYEGLGFMEVRVLSPFGPAFLLYNYQSAPISHHQFNSIHEMKKKKREIQ